MYNRLLIVLGVLLGLAVPMRGQNEIVQNPNAVRLRRVWMRLGSLVVADELGIGAAALGDISGDSLADVGLVTQHDGKWRIYLGRSPAPDTIATWVLDTIRNSRTPAAGDFWGNHHRSVIFAWGREETVAGVSEAYSELALYGFDTSGPRIITQSQRHERRLRGIQAANLDGKAGDELIVTKMPDSNNFGEVRIYQGGPGFQLDSPTVVIHDTQESDGSYFTVNTGDYDHDGRQDLLLSGLYADGAKLKFYFGDANSPWSWASRPPDRVILQTNGVIGVNVPPQQADLDGDNSPDLFGDVYAGPQRGSYVYLSGSGKNARTRSYLLEDADKIFLSSTYLARMSMGYMNDSSHHYEMLGMGGIVGLSGGPHGPDSSYEAYYNASEDGMVDNPIGGTSMAIDDVTGDGWNDFLGAGSYTVLVNSGIAIILAGGPYIPRDSATLDVRDVAAEGKPAGLSYWPNPVADQLTIAWRGDLKRMPARFEIYDLLGKVVASGPVEPWRGEATWRCAGVAPGYYRLVVLDRSRAHIASVGVIKE